MHINETKIEDQVLPEDLEEAIALIMFRDHYLAQMNKCLNTQDNKGVRHWIFEYHQVENDLKYLQFKKIDSERKMKNEKGN